MIKKVITFLSGKKTYIVGVCAIVYGFYSHSNDLIIIGLGMLGLRAGVTSEAKKILDVILPPITVNATTGGQIDPATFSTSETTGTTIK
jgi:hypothetical protein